MNTLLKKMLVLLPVVILGILYLDAHNETYRHVRNWRLLLLALSFSLLYGWIFMEVFLRKQSGFSQVLTQGSFYVYIFMVLTLTGYFILFREVSSHGWWHKLMLRIERRDHVNLELFKMFTIYTMFSKQVIGNFFMLFPLGIFLPILYKRISNLFLILLVSLLFSTSIELLQLITRFRSADVDDIFLNTLGACAGFLVYRLISFFIKSTSQQRQTATTAMSAITGNSN